VGNRNPDRQAAEGQLAARSAGALRMANAADSIARTPMLGPASVLDLQRLAGNRAVSAILAQPSPANQAAVVQRLTEAERRENLVSPRYANNARLQAAFDNNKAMGFAEADHDAVRLVQQGLVADGFPLPRSTKPSGELDGVYGTETVAAVTAFARKHTLPAKDGKAGRQVLKRLDELELGDAVGPNSTEDERRRALAINTLVAEQRRVYSLIEAGRTLVPGGAAPSRRDVLFRNSCQWIDGGKAVVHILVRTHDFAIRATKPGAQTHSTRGGLHAFFDVASAYPTVGGTYPLEPAPGEEANVAYAHPSFQGVTTNNDIQLVETATKTDDQIITTLIHETQHVADRIEGQRPGQQQGPGRVEVFDPRGGRDLQLEGVVNNYQTEFRAHWIERPEGDPQDKYGSANTSATNIAPVTFTDAGGTTHSAPTNFKNARQEAVFFDLIRNDYPFREPYATNAQFKRMVDDYELPAGVNLVNSARVDDLLNAITACNTNMASRHPKILAMMGAANQLDETDRRFLRDARLAKPFWDHADTHLNSVQLGRLIRVVNRPSAVPVPAPVVP
jgi:peptidoglycan hydrolase-like protein with peptidoglycan-binding domain